MRKFKNESGTALIIGLVVLMVSALSMPPLLGLTNAGNRGAQSREEKAQRLIAADAGIQNALWAIQDHGADLGEVSNFTLPDDFNWCDVEVEIIYDAANGTYLMISKATDFDGGYTEVQAHVVMMTDYSFLTEYGVITNGPLSVSPNTEVIGDARYQLPGSSIKGNITGDISNEEIENWPRLDDVTAYYKKQVEGQLPYKSIEIKYEPYVIGPMYLYNDGNKVNIISQKNKWARLDDTVYVEGDLNIKLQTGSYIDLNGNTLFVEGDIHTSPGTYFKGPGCIVATGDIEFKPNMVSPPGYIFVMSIDGSITMQPGTNFNGTLAAAKGIDLQPGGDIDSVSLPPPDDLNIPGMGEEGSTGVSSIQTYVIVE